jgi:hypothetical protein
MKNRCRPKFVFLCFVSLAGSHLGFCRRQADEARILLWPRHLVSATIDKGCRRHRLRSLDASSGCREAKPTHSKSLLLKRDYSLSLRLKSAQGWPGFQMIYMHKVSIQ